MPQDEFVSKEDFIDRVRKAHDRWYAAAARIPAGQWTAPLSGNPSWTLKDLQAHMTWSEREMINVLRSRIFEGSEWWNLPTDERNQRIYLQNRDRNLENIRQDAQESSAALLAELDQLTEADFTDLAQFQGMPADWMPWDVLAGNSYRHYDEHLPDVEALLETQ
jgi:uncharacterized damage-inducible protein DinB